MLRISNFGNPERFAKEKRREVSRLYDVRLGVSLFGKALSFAKVWGAFLRRLSRWFSFYLIGYSS